MSEYSDGEEEVAQVAEEVDEGSVPMYLLEKKVSGLQIIEDEKGTFHVVPHRTEEDVTGYTEDDEIRVYMNTHQIEVDSVHVGGVPVDEAQSGVTVGVEENKYVLFIEVNGQKTSAYLEEHDS